jgi:polar amino acid transport system substrate-binding protein
MNPADAISRELAPTGVLRAALNMGNPILASSNTSAESPAGVTVDLSREFAARLGVKAVLGLYKTAAEARLAVANGEADIGFMAIDAERAAGIHFTEAYVEIIGSYVVPASSHITSNDEVDRPGHDVVVGAQSAYDLFLTRELKHAKLVRVPLSEQVVREMVQGGYAVGAGIRQQLETAVLDYPDTRILEGGFMVIRQAVITPSARSPAATERLDAFVTWARSSGFVADSLLRHGIKGAQIASSS